MTASTYVRGFVRRSAYESARADEIRQQLYELLGPHCGICGKSVEGEPWEVNHKHPRDWKPSKLSKYRRNLRYLKEAQAGLVELSHKSCNAAYRPVPRGEPF